MEVISASSSIHSIFDSNSRRAGAAGTTGVLFDTVLLNEVERPGGKLFLESKVQTVGHGPRRL